MRIHLYSLLAVVLVAGCTNENATKKTSDIKVSDTTKSITEDSQQPELQPPVDNSLMLKEYIEAGVPAGDRSWTGNDMAKAAEILAGIAQQDRSKLPRYQSQNSGEMFKRLTADDNLDSYRNQTLPLQQRLPDGINYMQSSNQILKLYLTAFKQQEVGDSELVELIGAQLRVSAVMMTLVNEFLPSLNKDNPDYPARMEGLKRMKNGLATIVAGSLQTLTESQTYRPSELKRLIGYMQLTFPTLLPEVPESSRDEFITRLQSFSADPQMQNLNPELDKLLATVKASIQSNQNP
ncbi:hypothetical protein [Gimesia sp.]|uniref:hypothetical protein n=1 Tax=Gimesia sp. TaxID=2024833 RepID=UPI003A92A8FB